VKRKLRRFFSGDGTFDCVESPYEAVKRLNVGGETTLAVGCDIINETISTPALKAEAVAAAKAADVVILAIGAAFVSEVYVCVCPEPVLANG
jgi:hypothetical protein